MKPQTENERRVRSKLHDRVSSYRALFVVGPKEEADQIAPAAEAVLRDLAQYCYANKPTLKISPQTGMTDPYAMAFAEGRRDVWNRIVALCNLSETQIARIAQAREHE